MELYTATGGKIGRDRFEKALKSLQPLADKFEVDLVFSLFADSSQQYLDEESFGAVSALN